MYFLKYRGYKKKLCCHASFKKFLKVFLDLVPVRMTNQMRKILHKIFRRTHITAGRIKRSFSSNTQKIRIYETIIILLFSLSLHFPAPFLRLPVFHLLAIFASPDYGRDSLSEKPSQLSSRSPSLSLHWPG